MRMIPTRSFPPAINLPVTTHGANSFRKRLAVCIKHYSILTGCRRFSWARLKNLPAADRGTAEFPPLSMDQIKVLVISSVVPNALGSGGELVLHRHLKLNPRIQFEVMSWQRFPFRLKLIGKLRELGLRS